MIHERLDIPTRCEKRLRFVGPDNAEPHARRRQPAKGCTGTVLRGDNWHIARNTAPNRRVVRAVCRSGPSLVAATRRIERSRRGVSFAPCARLQLFATALERNTPPVIETDRRRPGMRCCNDRRLGRPVERLSCNSCIRPNR